jgi:hypothetical protein
LKKRVTNILNDAIEIASPASAKSTDTD